MANYDRLTSSEMRGNALKLKSKAVWLLSQNHQVSVIRVLQIKKDYVHNKQRFISAGEFMFIKIMSHFHSLLSLLIIHSIQFTFKFTERYIVF